MHDRSVDPFDVVRLIDDRYELVTQLDNGPRDKRSLESSIDYSRSTIDRAIRRLEEQHLVVRTEDGYQLTFPGKVLLECYEAWMRETNPIVKHSALFMQCPPDFDIPREIFRTGNLIQGDRFEPDRPVRVFLEQLCGAHSVTGVAPTTNEQYVNTLRKRTIEKGYTTEVVTPKLVIEYVFDTYPETMHEILRTDRCRIYGYDGEIEYGIAIMQDSPDEVGIGIYNRKKQLRGLILSDQQNVVDWALEKYRKFRAESKPITPECIS